MTDQRENSDSMQAQLQNARRMLVSGRRADAIEILRSAIGAPQAEPFVGNIALMLMRASDYDSALIAARRLAALHSDNVEAQSLLANVLADVGRVAEAIECATAVCAEAARTPSSVPSRNFIATDLERGWRHKPSPKT